VTSFDKITGMKCF